MHGVQSISDFRREKVDPARERDLRRLALQLVAQLPENTRDALDALEYAKTFVRAFLAEPEPI